MNNYANVKFGNECRSKLIEGVNLAANAVEVTYGPSGKNSIVSIGGQIKITKEKLSVSAFCKTLGKILILHFHTLESTAYYVL